MIAYTTAALPEASPLLPDRVAVGRPEDADGLRVLSDWARVQVWPGVALPPWATTAAQLQSWPLAAFADHAIPADPRSPEYAYLAGARLMRSLATTAAVTHVEGPDESDPYRITYAPGIPWVLHDADGYPVLLRSWEYLNVNRDSWGHEEPGHGTDPSADLWRWFAADRSEVTGTKSGQDRERTMSGALPNALRTGQAMHDALRLLLPRAKPPEPEPQPAPTYRRNQWR